MSSNDTPALYHVSGITGGNNTSLKFRYILSWLPTQVNAILNSKLDKCFKLCRTLFFYKLRCNLLRFPSI